MERIDEGIFKTKSGNFQAHAWVIGTDGKRKLRKKTFKTTTKAKAWRRSQLSKKDNGECVTPKDITLGELVTRFMALKEHKSTSHKRELARYIQEPSGIIEFFGEKTRIERINDAAILAWRNALENRPRMDRKGIGGLSPVSVSYRLKFMKAMLRYAHESGLISRVPRIELPKHSKSHQRELDFDFKQFQQVADGLDPIRGAMAWMMFYTGQRWGDVSTMVWSQVKQGRIYFKSTKTNRQGLSVIITPHMKKVLQKLRRFSPYTMDGLMFPNPETGKPYTDVRKAFDRVTERLKLGIKVRPHKVRHLAISEFLKNGGDEDLACMQFGMSKEVLRNHYGHPMNRGDEIINRIQDKMVSDPDVTINELYQEINRIRETIERVKNGGGA